MYKAFLMKTNIGGMMLKIKNNILYPVKPGFVNYRFIIYSKFSGSQSFNGSIASQCILREN